MTDQIIEQARELSIQSAQRTNVTGISPVLLYMRAGGDVISAWWSPYRDTQLRAFWKKSDHLSGALYNMISKMTAIPFTMIPADMSNESYVKDANTMFDRLMYGAQFGEGWVSFFSKFVEDLLSTDNGAFAEVIGEGDPSGPIEGMPISVAHLDSGRCTRTGNSEFPVVYQDTDGKLYKLHYSRVIYTSQMTSPIAEMNGVGFCSCSRCITIAQTLTDILVFQQEKMGSRPHRQVIVTKGGLDPDDVRSAFVIADNAMDAQGLSRYSKTVVMGSSSMPDADLLKIDLTSMPDGFDEETSITLGMATIALALGMDARELFPAMGAGATRADALLSHLKQKGKGPGQIIQSVETQFKQKFLPRYITMSFDFQDDAADMQAADIRNTRAQKRDRDIKNKALSIRTVREQMVEDGELTRQQFEVMELQDGRLEDGTNILSLFYSEEPFFVSALAINNVTDPLDTLTNDSEFMQEGIQKKLVEANKLVLKARRPADKMQARQALAALEHLKLLYDQIAQQEQAIEQEQEQMALTGKPAGKTNPDRLQMTRRENLGRPNQNTELGAPGAQDLQVANSDKPMRKL